MIPGTQETGTPQTDLDRRIEQHLLVLRLTEPKQNGALYLNLARMADYRDDQAEALRRYERSLAEFKTRKEPPEGAVPVVEGEDLGVEQEMTTTKLLYSNSMI